MSLTEQLYRFKCAYYTARLMLDPSERDVRLIAAQQDECELLAAMRHHTSLSIRISGRSQGYFFRHQDGHYEWIDRLAWLELEPCRLDLVRTTGGSHSAACHDLLVVPDSRPTHRLGICLLDLEAIEPLPAWMAA